MTHMIVDGCEIAISKREGSAPGLVWLGGYRSDMMGTKAVALDGFAEARGLACLRHDYSGHGESGGAFADGTISRWVNESLMVLDAHGSARNILVGSSMGAWIALRMVQTLVARGDQARLAGLVLIAPAPDFTSELVEPELGEAERRDLIDRGYFEKPSDYGEPYIYTRNLIEDGRNNRVLSGIIHTHCPVHILQGMQDDAVPWQHAMRLMDHLPADNASITLIKDGDHRLSRAQDIALLERVLVGMLADGGA
jgi:pimeloyl-ACP methyl ester carboxylesterase